MKVVSMSDTGRSRDINEDSHAHRRLSEGLDLLLVADGMGGHNAGEIASSIAVNTITDYIMSKMEHNIGIDKLSEILRDGIMQANSAIYQTALINPECSGMGTTVTAAILSKDNLIIGHVGDSRAYLWRDGKLTKVTNDHSLVAELVKNGTITEEEAEHHPQKNIITRALGAEDSVQVDIETLQITQQDIVLLCTDGLSNMICDAKIGEILLENGNIDSAAQKMIALANELGGYDNITVIIACAACLDGEVEQ